MAAVMGGAIAVVVVIIMDGVEAIAVITMVGRAVATAAGAKTQTKEVASVGDLDF
jgi:hypothetical protein